MIKNLICVFTNGKSIRLVKIESSGATTVYINDRTSKHIDSKADTNFGLQEVRGYILLDSYFE